MTSNYLWVEVKLYSIIYSWQHCEESAWWDFYSIGQTETTIKNNFPNPDVNTISCWYPFPITAITKLGLKLAVPPTSNLWRKKKIRHYLSPDKDPLKNYCWVENIISTRMKYFPSPQPCLRCGWYCDQSCQTWREINLNQDPDISSWEEYLK